MTRTRKSDSKAALIASREAASQTEKVKNEARRQPKKHGLSAGPRLARTTFKTSREMDFFSAKELVTQTGHSVSEWPLVFIKETIDNALDACEEANIAAEIIVRADPSGIEVQDNGGGLPEATLQAAMDFSVRASNREAYVAPDRGAQGNALKTLLPMPRVIDSEHGRLIVQAHGKRHVIRCGADPISQRAVIHDDVVEVPTAGTLVRMEWMPREIGGGVAWPFLGMRPCDPMHTIASTFAAMVEAFALFNPHATVSLDWFGERRQWAATLPVWDKWRPDRPTSAHWYEQRHIERLIGAYITHDRDHGGDRFVSDFIGEFDGLTGSAKRTKVLVESNTKRVRLSEFVFGDRLDGDRIGRLLAAMKRHTRPVKAQRLGIIGEEHLRARLLEMGVLADSFRYSRKVSRDGLPWVIETAFGWKGDASDDRRSIYVGANWSASIGNPFRSFGSTGEGLETVLADMRAGRNEPVVFVLHLAHPRVEYTDRGKSALVIGGVA